MKIGIENLSFQKKWGRVALVANQASIAKDFTPSWKIIHDLFGDSLTALFGPQHGFESTVQDNMIETDHGIHQPTGRPVYSLYSETREPTEKMLENVDTFIIDLQHSGTRVYTYKYTMAGCIRAAKKYGKHVVILDRPNPLGGEITEGNILEKDCTSFVGEFCVPMRHGLTMGELALFFNKEINHSTLEIIKLENWDPSTYYNELDRPWVLTSPNLPTFESCMAFCGTVLFEGANVSEGRGTCLPFQLIGSPFLTDNFIPTVLKYFDDDSIHLRSASFQPTFNKWEAQTCKGLDIHFKSKPTKLYKLGLAILRASIEIGKGQFAWDDKAYEYNFNILPIELIMGARWASQALREADFNINDPKWSKGLDQYNQETEHLYAR